MIKYLKEFIWVVRYAWYFSRGLNCEFSFGMECAKAAVGDYKSGENPIDAADEELGCWVDDEG